MVSRSHLCGEKLFLVTTWHAFDSCWISGDPLMTGFGGCRWYMKGQAGLVYNLISGPEDSLNTLLVPANLTDEHHNNDGTVHGAILVRHGDHNVTASVDDTGRLEGEIKFSRTRVRIIQFKFNFKSGFKLS